MHLLGTVLPFPIVGCQEPLLAKVYWALFYGPLLKRSILPPAVIAMVYRIGVYGFLLFRWWLFVIPGIITIFAQKFKDFTNNDHPIKAGRNLDNSLTNFEQR